MMTPAQDLHTAARHYCMDRSSMWRSYYNEERDQRESDGLYPPGAYSYLAEDYEVFPRYNVLAAILVEVERITPDDVRTADQMRSLLVSAGRTAESPFTQEPDNEIEKRVIAEERELFCGYISRISEDELRSVEPLPYRRVLSSEESQRLGSQLNQRWGVDREDYWHPLISEELPPSVVAFDAHSVQEQVPLAALHDILDRRGIRRLWELHEYGAEYEIDLELFAPVYTGSEGYWTAGEMDWLMYASHEGSLTIAGDWLIEEVRAAWPEWEQHLYAPYDAGKRWEEHPPKYGFYEVVRVGAGSGLDNLVGLEGAVIAISEEEDDRWGYDIYIYSLGETRTLPEEDLEPTGRVDREERFFGEGGIMGDVDADT